jgi:recombinase
LGNRNWRKSLAKARLARIANIPRPSAAVLHMMHRHRLECGSYRAIAARLNELGVKTPAGCKWYAGTVRTAMKRSLR